MKGVFDTRPDTAYDDDICRRYQFPNNYRAEAKRTENDWIIFREPRRGNGRQGYVAVARVNRIERDSSRPGYTYAYLSDYLDFDEVVPLKAGMQYYEARLNSVTNRSNIGAALRGRSIRTISEDEFSTITLAGLAETLHDENPHRLEHGKLEDDEALEAFVKATPEERKRKITQVLASRPLRDWAFRRSVVTAYKETCAVTGMRIVNGGGRAEFKPHTFKLSSTMGPMSSPTA